MHPDTLTKFTRWFVIPLNTVRNIPNGDGAFIALSIGCQLCERFYRAKSCTQEIQDGGPFQKEAGKSLGVGKEPFKRFWKAFRHGMQHQGSPRLFFADGINYKWQISGNFTELPQEISLDATTTIIRIDPWKFADLMIDKFLAEPAILEDAITHAFGNIYS